MNEQPDFNTELTNAEKKKSAELINWEQKRAEVEKITDGLGRGIDEKIKEAVTAFRVHDFPTSQSCEGHNGEEEGELFPWIEIYPPEPEGLEEGDEKEQKEKRRAWTAENLKQQKKMMELLAEFYQSRNAPFDARLIFDCIGAFGGFRVQSFGAEMMKLLSDKERQEKLELYRKEMNDFAEFLKDKYFNKSRE